MATTTINPRSRQAARPARFERLGTRALPIVAGCLVLKATAAIVANYAYYFPPNFRVDFLRGRETYFFGMYQWAFYAHIVSGPLALLMGLFLVSGSARRWFPRWHRALGRIQVPLVAFVVAPSGLAMAFRAQAGPIAGVGLGTLAVLTAATALIGGRLAARRRFADHRRWMNRCFALLCSSVVLRLAVGLAITVGVTPEWLDSTAVWMSWLVPLAVVEVRERPARSKRRSHAQSALPA